MEPAEQLIETEKQETDAAGVVFDPAIHAVKKDGTPKRTPKGTWALLEGVAIVPENFKITSATSIDADGVEADLPVLGSGEVSVGDVITLTSEGVAVTPVADAPSIIQPTTQEITGVLKNDGIRIAQELGARLVDYDGDSVTLAHPETGRLLCAGLLEGYEVALKAFRNNGF